MTLIKIRNLTIKEKNGKTLVHNINLDIKQHKVNVLIGESGSGKTLTTKAIIQQLPDDVVATYDTFSYHDQPVEKVQHILGKEIGYISQDYTHSFNDHTKLGKQLIRVYRHHYPEVSKVEARQHVKRALSSVNLGDIDILNRYRFMLSGGQLERVYIASVLMLEPKLIIADEPTASLDVINGHRLMRMIKQLAEAHGSTLLMITHNLSHVAQFSDYINVIKQGEMYDQGTMAAFRAHPEQLTAYTKMLFAHRTRLTKEAQHDSV